MIAGSKARMSLHSHPLLGTVDSVLSRLSCAGAMWWQWDMTYSPFVYDGGNLEVSYTDSTFQNVIEPSSAFLLSQAQASVAMCTKANQPATTTTSTATAGRRLMTA